jgi:energy-coupling factor transporter ATP-binding protein EcfA2
MDLKEAYRALDPAHPLDPDSPFYVPRPDNPVSRIIAEFQMTDTPRQYLLTGHRGTGKTTELNRIAEALSPHYAVQSINADSIIPLHDRVSDNLRDAILASAEGRDFPPGILSPNEMLRQRPPWRTRLVLIDGIDKLDLRDAISLCGEVSQIHCSAVCIIPLTLPLTEQFGDIAQTIDAWHFLPSIDLSDRHGNQIIEGWNLCRDVLTRRADIFTEAALDLLIENSAGIHRELLRLAQRACVFAAVGALSKIGADEALRAVHDTRNEYSILLRSEDFALLQQVEQTGRISGDHRLLRLVRDQLVVAYGGGSTWFAVHPIVRPLLPDTRKVASQR